VIRRRIIPSLLLRGGRLVKGVRFADHRDAGHPVTTARAHNAQGADELILIDIDASRERRLPDFDLVARIAAECFMPLTVGGGLRSADDARRCLDAGADKVLVNSGASDTPGLIETLAHLLGSQAVVLAVDVVDRGGGFHLFDYRGGTVLRSPDPLAWIRDGVARGAGEIRLMFVDREGTRRGFELDFSARVLDAVRVPVILEGGAGALTHLHAALEAGMDALALGTMLVFSDNNLVKVRRYLASAGYAVRV
jgi:cyclase